MRRTSTSPWTWRLVGFVVACALWAHLLSGWVGDAGLGAGREASTRATPSSRSLPAAAREPARPGGAGLPSRPEPGPRWSPAVPDALEFPVRGEAELTDSFHDPRPGGRLHEGVDILADKRQPVVAAARGRVRWVSRERGGRCCSLSLEHARGWQTRYLHLDNDSPGTDDGLAVGVRKDLVRGDPVAAGEVLGWVGDSGNAEETVPHLHFELRDPSGRPVDPYPYLVP